MYLRRYDWMVASAAAPTSAAGSTREGEGGTSASGMAGGGMLGAAAHVAVLPRGTPPYADALGNATESEELLCRYLAVSRLRVGVMPLCVVRVRATGVAVSEALNKSKSPVGLPRLCSLGLRRRGGAAHLELLPSRRDEEVPCPERLREVTAFKGHPAIALRSAAWAPTGNGIPRK